MSPEALAAYLDLLIKLMALAAQVQAQAVALSEKLKAMQAENRDPTPAEWAELHSQIDALRARL